MSSTRLLPVVLALGGLLPLGGCTDADLTGSPAAIPLGVRLDYLEPPCEVLPAGSLPAKVTLVELLVTRVGDGQILQQEGLLVDPAARCRDAANNEFACPFDVDGDGRRERFFALDPVPQGSTVRLMVQLKDELSNALYAGESAEVKVVGDDATVVTVPLRSLDPACSSPG